MEIRYGPFRPDSSGLNENFVVNVDNAVPDEKGFGPVGELSSATQPLPADPQGAATAINPEGGGDTFAGTAVKLYKLQQDQAWLDVTRVTGGDYTTPVNVPWRFIQFGNLIIGNNTVDVLQKFDVAASPAQTNYEPLGGTPPTARFIGTVGGFVVVSNITGGSPVANRVQWSGIGDPEEWSDVAKLSDFQDLRTGGPAGPIVSGEVGYIIQRNLIRRMLFVPGTPEIFQIEIVEEGRGTEAPFSVVQTGRFAFYLGLDGFYALDTKVGQSVPIGSGKVNDYFRNDQRARTDAFVLGGANPTNTLVFWPYISRNTAGVTPDKVLIYDWSQGEFGRGTFDILTIAEFITLGFSLDQLNPFGTVDTLPLSLDSAFWQAGKGELGVFSTDRKLSTLTGSPKAVAIETNDFVSPDNNRAYVSGISPLGDASAQTIRLAARERQDADAQPVFSDAVPMEVNGTCPVQGSGRYLRVRHEIPAGTDWTQVQGFDVKSRRAGKR